MKNLALLILFVTSSSVMAQGFQPIQVKTSRYQTNGFGDYKKLIGKHLEHCEVSTFTSLETGDIAFRMGIIGSNYDYFGWDVQISESELPLSAGFTKTIFVGSVMELTYDGKFLHYDLKKDAEVHTQLYSFVLEVDPNLQNVKSFSATLAGYDMSFGKPKKHVTESCQF